MLILASWLLGLLAVAVLIPTLVFAFQVFAGLGMPVGAVESTGRRPRLAVLVPAHDEAAAIAATLESIMPQLQDGDRLLVVADNCSDATATIARTHRATVVERNDAVRRGKGYALAYGVSALNEDPPEVLIVVDADCQVDANAIDRLARRALAADRPVQSLYAMRVPPGAGLKMRIAGLAWVVKNLSRPLGYRRFGLPCQLMGSGMAFPWADIRGAELASGHLVEDLKLGLDLCRRRRPPVFCPAAQVGSVFPENDEGARSQRTRWEHGHLGVIVADAPKLLVEAISGGNGPLLAMTLDLAVPPLAMLTLAIAFVVLCGSVAYVVYGAFVPLALSAAAAGLLTAAVLAAWARHGRATISLGSLLYAPIYALTKIPLYLGFLVKRQTEWVRSKRDAP